MAFQEVTFCLLLLRAAALAAYPDELMPGNGCRAATVTNMRLILPKQPRLASSAHLFVQPDNERKDA